MANDSAFLGVIVGVILVLGILYFAFGERMGIRTASGPSVTITAPTTTK